jgi:CMP-2-keto-3-deoxyoctulosonic acid synthetase
VVKVIVSSCVGDTSCVPDNRTRNARRTAQDAHYQAIYFSRSIPYDRDHAGVGDVGIICVIWVYAYRRDFLLKITSLPQTPLEKAGKT